MQPRLITLGLRSRCLTGTLCVQAASDWLHEVCQLQDGHLSPCIADYSGG